MFKRYYEGLFLLPSHHFTLGQIKVGNGLPDVVLWLFCLVPVYHIDVDVYQRLPDEAQLQTDMDWKRYIHCAHQNENKREAGFLPCWLLSL